MNNLKNAKVCVLPSTFRKPQVQNLFIRKSIKLDSKQNYLSLSPFFYSSTILHRFSTRFLPTPFPDLGFKFAVPPCRNLHSSGTLNNPRFKLKISQAESKHEKEDEESAESEEKKEPYLKSHPYRKVCPWKSKSELAAHLVENVIHNGHGLFVTNKPFGIGVRKRVVGRGLEGQQIHLRGMKLCEYTLEEVIPDLKLLLNKPNLELVKSTEKLTSGIAVFADDMETKERFHKALKSSRSYYDTMYTYHIVTTIPPIISDPTKVEHVGLTLKRAMETDMPQPVLVRAYSRNSVKRRDTIPFHVQTKVVMSGLSVGCLVEVNTSGIQNNFLRIHCADKLAPVLGDHLYSDRVRTIRGIPAKVDPTHLIPGAGHQRLSNAMVQILQLNRPEDSVIIPTHIHLRSYKLRKFLGNRAEMVFEAPYPAYFRWTCENLGITLDADQMDT